MYFIDGNHDYHEYLQLLPDTEDNIAPNITYQPRGSVREIEGKLCGFWGGAVSIDREYRETHGHYWSELEYSNVMLDQCVDVLFMHGCPDNFPGVKRPNNEQFNRSQDNYEYLAKECIKRASPDVIYHGHMHATYHRDFNGIPIIGVNQLNLTTLMDGTSYETL
jgi:hypothetical protein